MKGGHSMRRTMGALILGSVLALGVPGMAGAQSGGYLMLGGGVSLPMGDFKDVVGTGWLGQVAGGITAPGGMFGGRISASFIHHKVTGTDETFRILGAMADLVLSPKMSGKA